MAKKLSYADALKILGKKDSDAWDLAERLADGGLGLLGVPDLFGLRSLLVSKGREAVEGIREHLRGESRLTRTERILAAERVLAAVAFLEALDEVWEAADAPLTLDELGLSEEDRAALFGPLLSPGRPGRVALPHRWNADTDTGPRALEVAPQEAAAPSAAPWAHAPGVEEAAWREYFDGLAEAFQNAVPQVAAARGHGLDSPAHPLLAAVGRELGRRSTERYEELHRLLAADVPEFALWAHQVEHRRTRSAVDDGLGELRRLLATVASDRPVDRRREELFAAHRAVLERPVLRASDVPPGLVLPSLADAYIPPRGRVAVITPDAVPSSEEWWSLHRPVDDLSAFIAAHLTHPDATDHPTVVLGHPGAGKSKFTEVLAARLPASDFLPVRVELRAVSPNSPIHVQIEEGLAAALHTRVSWRDLADSADGALPVVILDGFDELLQATGVDRSDYLERVQEFQQQQEAMGLPVVVVVTSRTVVADRARFPRGTTVIKLDPFDEPRIGRLVGIWNRANARAADATGALTTEAVLRYRDLAEQPLLLMMLLIYDAEDGALRGTDQGLTHGELYERLLTMFARREVDKHHSGLGRHDLAEALEGELRRLEVAALAMFTRRRQNVSAEELDRDLAVLLPDAALDPDDTGMHGRIDPAHQVLGRFFFVHEARARTGDGTASVFEFLHATFGEYLVARAVVAALEELDASRSRTSRRRGRARRIDDGELYALLSFACLPGRDKVPDFLAELLERRFAEDPGLRGDYSDLLIELFREAPFPAANRSYADFEPQRLPVTVRQANYTANLVVLLVLVREDDVDLDELFPQSAGPMTEWRTLVGVWRSLDSPEWFGLLNAVRLRHMQSWTREGSRRLLSREVGDPVNVGECIGFELHTDVEVRPDVYDPYGMTIAYNRTISRMLRSISMRVNGSGARVLLGMLPYLGEVHGDMGAWFLDPDGDSAWLEPHEVLKLRLSPPHIDPEGRLNAYRRMLTSTQLGRLELLVLRQAAEDLRWPGTGDGAEYSPLRRLVREYLSGVDSVVSGNRLAKDAVAPVLALFPPGFLPDGTVERIIAIVDQENPQRGRRTRVTAHLR
ncbi:MULTISPECIES: NACHT domain-containing protein [Nocardiopsis]|uniref:NACHT N-terminal Helical domain-containing protein n=1 Tax=Nocardiopsis changdeensis TaxID=2831969 RepID=A0ABX8BJB2_9ACTN|nr:MULTISPECIES: hypothetical protein [Nocardiopsis]QUX21021.1 hypothetical protein KGD84_21545 [Nocardiopsis changdeensis]QYX36951.1 hypothetical protein K1J57_31000 [Nocardiopsis sp. MT53]